MYNNVSAAFKAAFNNTYQERYLRIGMQYKDSHDATQTITLTHNDIVAGTFRLDKSALPGAVFELGGVISAGVEFTIWNDDKRFSGCKLKGAKLTPEMGIKLPGGTIEYCPLGIFYIDECGKSYARTIAVKATDGLMKFEVPVDYSLFSFPCTLEDVFELACSTCNIAISSASMTLPQYGNEDVAEFTDDAITWRDIIGYIAILAGGFVRMDRTGKVEIVSFIRNANNTIDISAAGMRMDLETDEQVKISGIAYYGDKDNYLLGTAEYPIVVPECEMYEKMQINALLTMRTNLYATYHNFTYYPFSLEYAGNPLIDAGDWVQLDETDEGTIYSVITELTLNFDSKSNLSAAGVDELDKNFLDKRTREEEESGGGGDYPEQEPCKAAKPNLLRRTLPLYNFNYKDPSLGNTVQNNEIVSHNICGGGGTLSGGHGASFTAVSGASNWIWQASAEIVGNLGTNDCYLIDNTEYTLSALVGIGGAAGRYQSTIAFDMDYGTISQSSSQHFTHRIVEETYPEKAQGTGKYPMYQWVSWTFNTSDIDTTEYPNVIRHKLYRLTATTNNVAIHKIKLEQGDHRTEWCPHISEKYTFRAMPQSYIWAKLGHADDESPTSDYKGLYNSHEVIGAFECANYIYQSDLIFLGCQWNWGGTTETELTGVNWMKITPDDWGNIINESGGGGTGTPDSEADTFFTSLNATTWTAFKNWLTDSHATSTLNKLKNSWYQLVVADIDNIKWLTTNKNAVSNAASVCGTMTTQQKTDLYWLLNNITTIKAIVADYEAEHPTT